MPKHPPKAVVSSLFLLQWWCTHRLSLRGLLSFCDLSETGKGGETWSWISWNMEAELTGVPAQSGAQISQTVRSLKWCFMRDAVLNLSLAEAEEMKSFLNGFPPTFCQWEPCPLTFRGDVPLSFLNWEPLDVCLHCNKLSKDPYGSLAEVSWFWSSHFWPFLLFQVHSYHRLIYCIPCPFTTWPALCSRRSPGSSTCWCSLWEDRVHPSSPCPFHRDSSQLQVTSCLPVGDQTPDFNRLCNTERLHRKTQEKGTAGGLSRLSNPGISHYPPSLAASHRCSHQPAQMSLLLTVPIPGWAPHGAPTACTHFWAPPTASILLPAGLCQSPWGQGICLPTAPLLIHTTGSPRKVLQEKPGFLVTKQRFLGWSLSDKSWDLCHSLFVTKLQDAALNPTDSFPWSASGIIEVSCLAQCDYKLNHSFTFSV